MRTVKFKDINNENKEISVEELTHSELLFTKGVNKVVVITEDKNHYEMDALTFSCVFLECEKIKCEEGWVDNGAREEIEHYIN